MQQARLPTPCEIVFSYSHVDEKLRDQLEVHLGLLKREGVITGWHDRKITPGTEWRRQIGAAIDRCNIVVLLISADFINSDYCFDVELTRALERHEAGEARVIPVIIRPCDWHSAPFGKLQALPKRGKPITTWNSRDAALADVAKGIRKAVEESVGLSSGV